MKYQIMVKAPEKDAGFVKIERALQAGFRVKWGNGGEIVMIARPMTATGDVDTEAPAAMLIEGSWWDYHKDKKMCAGRATILKGWPGSLIEVPDAKMVGADTDGDEPDIHLGLIPGEPAWKRAGFVEGLRSAAG